MTGTKVHQMGKITGIRSGSEDRREKSSKWNTLCTHSVPSIACSAHDGLPWANWLTRSRARPIGHMDPTREKMLVISWRHGMLIISWMITLSVSIDELTRRIFWGWPPNGTVRGIWKQCEHLDEEKPLFVIVPQISAEAHDDFVVGTDYFS